MSRLRLILCATLLALVPLAIHLTGRRAAAPVSAVPPPGPTQAAVDEWDAVIADFLQRFDRVSAMGYVKTLRAGDTGIGYTLETLLGIEENNSPRGDFRGMEIKAFRDSGKEEPGEKMNLFLKEPEWIDDLSAAERVQRYGYFDEERQRQALYSTPRSEENGHGFALSADHGARRVWLVFHGKRVAFWTAETLAKRLAEKHSAAVFVSARTRGAGRDEEFHYQGVLWCREPSPEAFLQLISAGDVMLELRMHLEPDGSVRNHGSAFRVRKDRIPALYRSAERLRPRGE